MRVKSTSIVFAALVIGTVLTVGVNAEFDNNIDIIGVTLTPAVAHSQMPTKTAATKEPTTIKTQTPTPMPPSPTSTNTPIPTSTQTPLPSPTPSPTRNPVYSVSDGIVTIEMAYFVTAYDPSLCWKVPQYMIDEDYFANHDPETNCSEFDPKTIEEDWKWNGAGYYIPDNYGLMASCPEDLALFDGAYVSLEVVVDGIGKRYCRDSGSAILIIGTQHHPELGVEVPYMNVDILWNFQIENNFPPWKSGLNFGEMRMTIEQFDEKRHLLGL